LIIIVLQLLCIQQVTVAQDSTLISNPFRHKFKAEPMKATMLAVVLPGLGQIYNRKYWKIPLVYAGFGSLIYAIGFNSSHYITFIQAYQDFTDDNPATVRYQEIPGLKGLDPMVYDKTANPQTYSYYSDQMLRFVDSYKRYRDLSYIALAGWYLITIIDANVDASLFNYDISDKLDVAILPAQMSTGGKIGTGINVSMKFKF
jgi:hypothetical protein